jgi:hypothetical protein
VASIAAERKDRLERRPTRTSAEMITGFSKGTARPARESVDKLNTIVK